MTNPPWRSCCKFCGSLYDKVLDGKCKCIPYSLNFQLHCTLVTFSSFGPLNMGFGDKHLELSCISPTVLISFIISLSSPYSLCANHFQTYRAPLPDPFFSYFFFYREGNFHSCSVNSTSITKVYSAPFKKIMPFLLPIPSIFLLKFCLNLSQHKIVSEVLKIN